MVQKQEEMLALIVMLICLFCSLKKNSPEKEHSIVSKLYEIELKNGVVISSIIMSKDDWVNPAIITPFYLNVKREGILL